MPQRFPPQMKCLIPGEVRKPRPTQIKLQNSNFSAITGTTLLNIWPIAMHCCLALHLDWLKILKSLVIGCSYKTYNILMKLLKIYMGKMGGFRLHWMHWLAAKYLPPYKVLIFHWKHHLFEIKNVEIHAIQRITHLFNEL